MREYRIDDAPPANTPRLDEELRAALGAVYLGLATDPEGVRVFFDEDATGADEATARATVLAHDHTQLSTVQAAEAAVKARIITDLERIITETETVSTVEALRAQVLALAQLVGRLAEAAGFTPAVDTGQ